MPFARKMAVLQLPMLGLLPPVLAVQPQPGARGSGTPAEIAAPAVQHQQPQEPIAAAAPGCSRSGVLQRCDDAVICSAGGLADLFRRRPRMAVGAAAALGATCFFAGHALSSSPPPAPFPGFSDEFMGKGHYPYGLGNPVPADEAWTGVGAIHEVDINGRKCWSLTGDPEHDRPLTTCCAPSAAFCSGQKCDGDPAKHPEGADHRLRQPEVTALASGPTTLAELNALDELAKGRASGEGFELYRGVRLNWDQLPSERLWNFLGGPGGDYKDPVTGNKIGFTNPAQANGCDMKHTDFFAPTDYKTQPDLSKFGISKREHTDNSIVLNLRTASDGRGSGGCAYAEAKKGDQDFLSVQEISYFAGINGYSCGDHASAAVYAYESCAPKNGQLPQWSDGREVDMPEVCGKSVSDMFVGKNPLPLSSGPDGLVEDAGCSAGGSCFRFHKMTFAKCADRPGYTLWNNCRKVTLTVHRAERHGTYDAAGNPAVDVNREPIYEYKVGEEIGSTSRELRDFSRTPLQLVIDVWGSPRLRNGPHWIPNPGCQVAVHDARVIQLPQNPDGECREEAVNAFHWFTSTWEGRALAQRYADPERYPQDVNLRSLFHRVYPWVPKSCYPAYGEEEAKAAAGVGGGGVVGGASAGEDRVEARTPSSYAIDPRSTRTEEPAEREVMV